MESISEKVIENRRQTGSKSKDNMCPDLILEDMIVCGALGRFYQPSRRQIRECCANEYHVRCSLRRSG